MIIPWEVGAEKMNYDKEDSTQNYVSVTSHEIAMYSILQNIQQNRHVILMGPTGTGKSTVLEKVVLNNAKIIFKDRVEFWMTTSTTALDSQRRAAISATRARTATEKHVDYELWFNLHLYDVRVVLPP